MSMLPRRGKCAMCGYDWDEAAADWNPVKISRPLGVEMVLEVPSGTDVSEAPNGVKIQTQQEVMRAETFICKAQKTSDPPQDCDWPTCGCDPYADKVIAALDEAGCLKPGPDGGPA